MAYLIGMQLYFGSYWYDERVRERRSRGLPVLISISLGVATAHPGCTLDQGGARSPLADSDAGAFTAEDESEDPTSEETSASRPARSTDTRPVQWADAAAAERAGADAGADGPAGTLSGANAGASESARGRSLAEPELVAKRCRPGTYTGSFEGTLRFADLPVGNVRGTVRTKLQIAPATDNLTLSGKIAGADADGNRVTAHVSGLLDCATHQFVDARLERGSYDLPRSLLAGARPSEFGGKVSAVYSDNPPAVVGEWSTDTMPTTLLAASELLLSGQGNFHITLAPANTPCDCD